MNVLPLKTQVLVAENKKEDTTESGIIIEGTRGTGNTAKATVLAVGPDVTDVKVDDVVLLDWSKASPVKIGDVQRAMIKEEFIIGVFGD
jgi:co-chaperonin GroES (HSP10)